ncbi:aldehyde dehydrogenase [Pseudoclavibacter chungangensis]|uniref:Aldehyde dehydrogenase n=2 Tax=Pseudoclavibacter chungangensis TaxID=587635 RepID=A0A7J5BSU2_9MICO|nr:aldehyde dehydrogenase family protein [Pseudoclavibacter chungangensis]KAB1656034.1 aldehyde dehydrogenase [Pseudoclavibacter chungangensis]
MDAAITRVRAGSERWATLSLEARASIIAAVHRSLGSVARRWVEIACDIKGIEADSPLVGEEWISGPYATISGAGALAHSLAELAACRSPAADARIRPGPDGRSRIRVLPHAAIEGVLLHGFSGEVWTTPHVSADEVVRRAGLGAVDPTPGVGVVLGAGNITSIAPLDVLWELVARGRGVVLKLNPTLERLRPVLEAGLEPLVAAGVLRFVSGGADVGAALVEHDGIDHVHITGSAATHDAIVWGSGEEAVRRRAEGTPRLRVPISSELGGVSPVIVVPGRWSHADLRFQAEHIATMRLHNAGHNCIAGQVVVVSADWPQREAFLRELRTAIDRAPARPVWYPGAAERVTASARRDGAASLGPATSPRVLIDTDDPATLEWLERTELFAPVLGVVELPGVDATFLDAAVSAANDRLAGTLGANIVIDPATLRRIGAARFGRALTALRYGTIAVNAWTGLGFLTSRASWGAFPGGSLADVGSGVGVVHNALLLDDVERTVVRGPFRPFPRSVAGGEFSLFPKPPWFVTARSAARTGRLLSGFATKPAWQKLPAIFASAFRA